MGLQLIPGLLGTMTDRQRGFIGNIFSSGQHLLSLINDILDLSKVESGKMQLDLEPVPVSLLFTNSLSIVREKAATRHIRLQADSAGDLGAFQVDARKVKQIVYNLLSNAVKFSREGGHVTLRADRVPRAAVGRPSGSWVARTLPLPESAFAEFLQISVSDNGIGISPEGLAQLFEPFSQIDSGLARQFEGTGLGLALVKAMAQLHGGTVAVESAMNEGSRFTVWLPLRTPAHETRSPGNVAEAPSAAASEGGLFALVVEDDPSSAELIRVQLESQGFMVQCADSAEGALALSMDMAPSLITLDIMLPGMDGWTFLAQLKQVPRLRGIPVVIVSIVADSGKGLALGAASVLQKPFTRLELSEVLVNLSLVRRSQSRPLTILLVDDDDQAVELAAIRVHGLAATVLRAYGGREAIEAVRHQLPDVIVLDLMMPEVNGFEVVAALRERTDTAHIPIVVVTAMVLTAEDRARLDGQVCAVLEKAGLDTEGFLVEIRRALAGRAKVA